MLRQLVIKSRVEAIMAIENRGLINKFLCDNGPIVRKHDFTVVRIYNKLYDKQDIFIKAKKRRWIPDPSTGSGQAARE